MDHSEWVMPTHIIAAAAIVTNKNDEILLVKTHRHGWVFPGGQVEVGENIIDAVKREVMEESGIEIEVGEVFCISSNTCKYPGYDGVKEVPTKIMLDFICMAKCGAPRPSDENSDSASVYSASGGKLPEWRRPFPLSAGSFLLCSDTFRAC